MERMSVQEKMELQGDYIGAWIKDTLNFSGLRAIFAPIGAWMASQYGGAFDNEMIAWIATIWVCDYAFGTLLAIRRRNWTPVASSAGLLRAFAWSVLIVIFWGLSKTVGAWLYDVILVAILLTESASFLEKIIDLFPESRLTRVLRAVLRLINRKFNAIVESIDKTDPLNKPQTPRRRRQAVRAALAERVNDKVLEPEKITIPSGE